MIDAAATAEVIRKFVDLAIAQRRHALSREDRERISDLEQQLRDMIDGARPGARKIGAHAAARSTLTDSPTVISDDATSPLKPTSLETLSKRLELSLADKKKVSEISVDELPASSYTRPIAPSFMADYYSEDITASREIDPHLVPTAVVGVDGGTIELSREVRILFGLEWAAEEAAASARSSEGSTRAAPADASAPRGRPTIVHLLAGGVYRGQIDPFDPSSGFVQFVKEERSGPLKVRLSGVLAIFFGLQRGEQPPPPSGQRVVVKLVNDRQVAGLTDDYEEGGEYLTIMPEQRRGNVDRIWIPAWAVKEIQLG